MTNEIEVKQTMNVEQERVTVGSTIGDISRDDVAKDGLPKSSSSLADPFTTADSSKRPAQTSKQPKKSKGKKYKNKVVDATAPMGVLQHEIDTVLKENNLSKSDIGNDITGVLNNQAIEEIYHRKVEDVKVVLLLSNGDGIAIIEHPTETSLKQVVIVPFGLPGDVCTIKVFKTHPLYAESDLLEVHSSSEYRNDDLITCKYFGKCSGCQYQNVLYEQQLLFKKQTIVNAFKFFAPLLALELPTVLETEPSPLQYNYRTKLTPHFNIPYKKTGADFISPPNLGFGSKGRPTWRDVPASGAILDIEECSIGTAIINKGMDNERKRFMTSYKSYKKGATILLREDTQIGKPATEASTDSQGEISTIEVEVGDSKLFKTCSTRSRQVVNEYINGYTFEFSAGEFFQNNNSILPSVTSYVKSNLTIEGNTSENYLVDAYCGSGLFSITCSEQVSKVIGVEVSADSVKFAERNAEINKIANTKFIVGKAEEIFGSIDTPPSQTSVILDPPRKGCDEVFLKQLSSYNPAKIVYISCNVHSQARDVEWFLKNTEKGGEYIVESIKGFDFFPQTHHVESIAVLTRKS